MWYGQVEGTDIVVLDPRFKACFAGHVRVERLWTGARWAEGPAWFAAGRYLVWSDIPNNRMMRFVETDGEVSRLPPAARNNSNGNTVDNQGRLVTCEHLDAPRHPHRVSTARSPSLPTSWQGKRLNSPNDVVVKSDDSIWFTDPAYGIDTDYEGDAPQQRDRRLPCLSRRPQDRRGRPPSSPTWCARTASPSRPTRSYLYVADTGATHNENGPRHIRRFTVDADGQAVGRRGLRRVAPSGLFDGFRVDRNGRIWTSAAEGVHCYDRTAR